MLMTPTGGESDQLTPALGPPLTPALNQAPCPAVSDAEEGMMYTNPPFEVGAPPEAIREIVAVALWLGSVVLTAVTVTICDPLNELGAW